MRILVSLSVVVCAVLCGASPVRAQSVSFGLKGGMVAATATVDDPDGIDFNTGVGAIGGMFVTFDLGSRVRLQPELLFGQRRFDASNFPIEITSTGAEVPILLQFTLGRSDRLRPVLLLGPQINFISRVTQTSAAGETDISDDIANVDAGVSVGAGLDITAGRGTVVFDVRVNFGMKDLSTASGPSLRSRGTLVLAGYRF
jgi:hypothetical protein